MSPKIMHFLCSLVVALLQISFIGYAALRGNCFFTQDSLDSFYFINTGTDNHLKKQKIVILIQIMSTIKISKTCKCHKYAED